MNYHDLISATAVVAGSIGVIALVAVSVDQFAKLAIARIESAPTLLTDEWAESVEQYLADNPPAPEALANTAELKVWPELSRLEVAVLGSLFEDYGVRISSIADDLGVTIPAVRGALASLREHGLVFLGALFDDEGRICGRGNLLTPDGEGCSLHYDAPDIANKYRGESEQGALPSDSV